MFILSILVFFIVNGIESLTLKQIFIKSERRLKCSTKRYPIALPTFSDVLLIASVVGFIIYFNYPHVVEFFGGLILILIQKAIIWLITNLKRFIHI